MLKDNIKIKRGFPISIHDCKIQQSTSWTSSPFIPIEHAPGIDGYGYPSRPNNGIGGPIILTAETLIGSINIEYSTNSHLESENAPFIVDFYEVAPDGSIVDHIGSQNIATADEAIYSASFTGVLIDPGNKIGGNDYLGWVQPLRQRVKKLVLLNCHFRFLRRMSGNARIVKSSRP